MKTSGNVILITGGSSGIGMALAERFLALNNDVIICGRRPEALDEIKRKFPKIKTIVADVGNENDRIALVERATKEFPKLNVLINNAGIQRKVDLTQRESWRDCYQEIAINIEGPIHLSMLFAPHLLRQADPAILNVSSGLAFVPLASVPIYSATKAAIHSFTMSLRYQLRNTTVKVVEIIPPAVRTNLGGAHDFGAPLNEYADSVIQQLKEGRQETTYQFSAQTSQASRAESEEIFQRMNPA
jgi:uncharacterized oxidoreductase